MQWEDPFKDKIVDALQFTMGMHCQRMYRYWGLYHGDHFIGIIQADRLYLRTNHLTRLNYIRLGMKPLHPTDRILRRFYAVPAGIIENSKELMKWALEAAAIKYTVPKFQGEYHGG